MFDVSEGERSALQRWTGLSVALRRITDTLSMRMTARNLASDPMRMTARNPASDPMRENPAQLAGVYYTYQSMGTTAV